MEINNIFDTIESYNGSNSFMDISSFLDFDIFSPYVNNLDNQNDICPFCQSSIKYLNVHCSANHSDKSVKYLNDKLKSKIKEISVLIQKVKILKISISKEPKNEEQIERIKRLDIAFDGLFKKLEKNIDDIFS